MTDGRVDRCHDLRTRINRWAINSIVDVPKRVSLVGRGTAIRVGYISGIYVQFDGSIDLSSFSIAGMSVEGRAEFATERSSQKEPEQNPINSDLIRGKLCEHG